jgi:hypothetical protein
MNSRKGRRDVKIEARRKLIVLWKGGVFRIVGWHVLGNVVIGNRGGY